MAIVSSIFFVLSLVLAVTIGPQTRPWPWGPALIALGVAALTALPAIWRDKRARDFGFIAFCLLLVSWFGWRAWISPVAELAMADLLLLLAAVASFIVIRVIAESTAASRVFFWGLALLLAASVVVVARQVIEPTYNPIFASRRVVLPTGFFGHYNDGANFLIGASLLLASAGFFVKEAKLTKVAWIVIAVAGLVAVYFTRSRGAILGVGVGVLAFGVMAALVGKRTKTAWFAPLAIGLPILAIVAAGFVLYGWQSAQATRFQETGVEGLLDNSIRLYLMGIAFSCIGLHPWMGGGSGSFSWECYQFWTVQDNGWTSNRPDKVHNELLQALTDYGVIGGVAVMILLAAVIVMALVRVLSTGRTTHHPRADALVVGGLAALAGMLVQSSFSFVFHLLPGVILLGICLGAASLPASMEEKSAPKRQAGLKICLSMVVLMLVAILLPNGWKGTQVTKILWPTFFAPQAEITAEDRIEALSDAIHLWPQAAFYKDRALLFQDQAARNVAMGDFTGVDETIADYRAGLALHPYEVSLSVNLANFLSFLGRDAEAYEEYARTVRLQGGMEIGFRGHFHAATTLVKIARKQLIANENGKALETFKIADQEFSEATKGYPSLPATGEGITLKNSITEGLGLAFERSGDFEGALSSYQSLIKSGGAIGNYRAGILLANLGATDFYERRPSEALTRFLAARGYLTAATELPGNVTVADRNRKLAEIDQAIQWLVGGKTQPLQIGE